MVPAKTSIIPSCFAIMNDLLMQGKNVEAAGVIEYPE